MTVAVVGAGSIGASWAVVFARGGHPVRLLDPDETVREAALAEVARRAGDLERHGLLAEPAAAVTGRVSIDASLEDALEGAVHVQENAPEQIELKRELLAEIDRLTPPDATIGSSSSALTASELAAGLPGASRVLIAHPANPPHILPVVELVPAPFTDPSAVDRVEMLMEACGMRPVSLRHEIEGFVFNRLQGAVLREAYCLVRDGIASSEDIDTVVRDGLARRWSVVGPFETADLNVRGGITAHAERMGHAYARMGVARGQDDPWTPELVAQVASERRAALPLDDWADRVAWRDEQLLRRASAQ
ncbi:MAG: 3-hydroxyacyl-CoA dehydrogenase [Baekduia sp.]